jgi:hypothetical protein
MLKLIGFCLKLAAFSVIILILGNWIRWDGRTISDQVKLRMSHAERTNWAGTVRNWAERVTHDAREGMQKKKENTNSSEPQEELTSSERQKLKALIRELNSSHKRD